jgi:hypothetical protein
MTEMPQNPAPAPGGFAAGEGQTVLRQAEDHDDPIAGQDKKLSQAGISLHC